MPMRGMLRRPATQQEKLKAMALCRGRGYKDPIIKKLPQQRRAYLKAVIRQEAIIQKCHPSELVWRMDRSGAVHVYRNNVGRIG